MYMAHSAVWIVSGALWSTIDFANYMSHAISTAYHIFVFVATALEFAKVCAQIADPTDIPATLYSHSNINYSLYDFKMDGLCLMLWAEMCTICTLARDRKREWYCFGLAYVLRQRLLSASRVQRAQLMSNSH